MGIIYWVYPQPHFWPTARWGSRVIDILPEHSATRCTVRHSWMAKYPAQSDEQRQMYDGSSARSTPPCATRDFVMLPQCSQRGPPRPARPHGHRPQRDRRPAHDPGHGGQAGRLAAVGLDYRPCTYDPAGDGLTLRRPDRHRRGQMRCGHRKWLRRTGTATSTFTNSPSSSHDANRNDESPCARTNRSAAARGSAEPVRTQPMPLPVRRVRRRRWHGGAPPRPSRRDQRRRQHDQAGDDRHPEGPWPNHPRRAPVAPPTTEPSPRHPSRRAGAGASLSSSRGSMSAIAPPPTVSNGRSGTPASTRTTTSSPAARRQCGFLRAPSAPTTDRARASPAAVNRATSRGVGAPQRRRHGCQPTHAQRP